MKYKYATFIVLILNFLFIGCSNDDSNAPLNNSQKLKIELSVENKSLNKNSKELIVNVKLKNISTDTVIILGKNSTYFYRQFAFKLTFNKAHSILLNRLNTYSTTKEPIKLVKGESIKFQFDLIKNYDFLAPGKEGKIFKGELICFFNPSVKKTNDSSFRAGIRLISQNKSNKVMIKRLSGL